MRRGKGFTLVELLVVVAIIAILMAILIPALQRARKQAKAVVCQSNLHQWGLIFQTYTQDWDGRFNSIWPNFANPEDCSIDQLMAYDDSFGRHFFCPMAATEKRIIPWAGPLKSETFMAWACSRHQRAGSYGQNLWCGNWDWRDYPDDVSTEWWESRIWRHTFQAGPSKSNVPVFLDCQGWGTYPLEFWPPPREHESDFIGPTSMDFFAINRHDGYINGLFMDWSVRKIGLKGLWRLKWHRKCDTNGWSGGWPEWMRNFKDY